MLNRVRFFTARAALRSTFETKPYACRLRWLGGCLCFSSSVFSLFLFMFLNHFWIRDGAGLFLLYLFFCSGGDEPLFSFFLLPQPLCSSFLFSFCSLQLLFLNFC